MTNLDLEGELPGREQIDHSSSQSWELIWAQDRTEWKCYYQYLFLFSSCTVGVLCATIKADGI
jgi:hypothetical protein